MNNLILRKELLFLYKVDVIQKILELMIEVEFFVMILLERIEKLLSMLMCQDINTVVNTKREKRILRIEDRILRI